MKDRQALFELNLAAMGDLGFIARATMPKTAPAVAKPATKEEGWSFIHNSRHICSEFAPVTEAHRFAQSSGAPRFVVVLGLGGGAKIAALAEMGFTGIVVETDIALARAVLEHVDLTNAARSFRLAIGPLDVLQRELSHLSIKGTPFDLLIADRGMHGANDIIAFCERLTARCTKVLVVGPIYGGSLPAAQFSVAALKDLGHDATFFDCSQAAGALSLGNNYVSADNRTTYNSDLTSFLSRAVEMAVREQAPDFVLALAQAPLLPETLRSIQRMGVGTALWFVEDWQTLTWWQQVAGSYDIIFGIQKDERFTSALQRKGSHFHYLPTCGDRDFHVPSIVDGSTKREYGGTVSFVGAAYYNRQRLFRALLDLPLALFGDDWDKIAELSCKARLPGHRLSTSECLSVFNSSDINLNLHSSIRHEGVDPDGDFVNPRTFELALAGCFQLTDRRKHLPELFPDGLLPTFDSVAELKELINAWLADESGRKAVADKARSFALQRHTYHHRMAELTATVLAKLPSVAAKVDERDKSRRKSLEICEHDPELRRLAAQANGSTTLTDLLQVVGGGDAAMSDTEMRLLALASIPVIHRSAK